MLVNVKKSTSQRLHLFPLDTPFHSKRAPDRKMHGRRPTRSGGRRVKTPPVVAHVFSKKETSSRFMKTLITDKTKEVIARKFNCEQVVPGTRIVARNRPQRRRRAQTLITRCVGEGRNSWTRAAYARRGTSEATEIVSPKDSRDCRAELNASSTR